jgi:DNA-binding transcriptional MerR regulator/SAM-dependent methyltransferase
MIKRGGSLKIGKFAEKNQLSLDAIRHYMDLGLIVPEKNGGQYHFDDRCQKDLEFILELKGMGFLLQEIKKIFYYRNFGQLADYEENVYYQSLFTEKYKALEKEINSLTEMKEKLQLKLEEEKSDKTANTSSSIGIDLRVLHLLRCFRCGDMLSLLDGRIQQNHIIEGKLSCTCGEEYLVDSGILIVGKPHESTSEHLFAQDIANYIQATDPDYLENLHKGLQWGSRKIAELDLQHKILLELGTGAGYFLRTIYQQLPEDALYIAVDHNLEKQRFLKRIIEKTGSNRKILFICSDFLEIPLGQCSVDILLDLAGSSNYSFQNEAFLLQEMDGLLKPKGLLLASFIAFKNFSSNSKVQPPFRKYFTAGKIKEKLAELSYSYIEERTSLPITKGGQFENFFVDGEEIFTYSCLCKRLG